MWLKALACCVFAACGKPPGPGGPVAVLSAMVRIPGATYQMGDARYADQRPDETPQKVSVDGFSIMRFEVTNDQYAEFATASGHRSHPETGGWGFVWTGTWHKIEGADWQHPTGPGSSIVERGDHPVVQVSVADAAAYCRWRGLRLPSEAEWELAARGVDGRRYPWGDEHPVQTGPRKSRRANFGTVRCCAADASDGYETTAPIGSYAEGISPYGVYDMAGNVWEWTSDPFPGKPGTAALRGGGWGNNPFCLRTTYRHANSRNIGRDHIGIRCAGD